MPASTEPRSGLFYGWSLGESGWNAQMDSNILNIGRFGFHLSVKDRDLSAPPANPTSGDTYIVGTSPTDAWAGHADHVAVWTGSAWAFGVPRVGWMAYVEDEDALAVYKSSGWGLI